MTPLLFGDSASPLFGVLHEPLPGTERGHGVLLCPPIGQEHVRTHWALRQVATSLARAGHHVLRFDWFGVGDSSGNLADATVARWIEDARTAAQELRDAAGLRRIAVLGLRFGATLAALASGKIKPATLVLWDPVPSGAAHIAELSALHAGLLADTRRYWRRWPANVRKAVERVFPDMAHERALGAGQLVGFQFGAALRKDLVMVDAHTITDLGSRRVVVIESDARPEIGAFAARLAAVGASVERRPTEVRGRWDEPRQVEELLLPADAVRIITEALDGRTA